MLNPGLPAGYSKKTTRRRGRSGGIGPRGALIAVLGPALEFVSHTSLPELNLSWLERACAFGTASPFAAK